MVRSRESTVLRRPSAAAEARPSATAAAGARAGRPQGAPASTPTGPFERARFGGWVRGFALPLLFLLSAAACEREPAALDELDYATAVHAVLRAGTDTVRVVVSRVAPHTSYAGLTSVPVSGAEIRITGPAGAVDLVEAAPELGACWSPFNPIFAGQPGETREGCYSGVLPAVIAPGDRYELRAALPAGDTVRGAATIPQPLVLIEPAGEVRVALPDDYDGSLEPASIPVRWPSSSDVARTAVSLTPAAPFADGHAVPDAVCGIGTRFETTLGGDGTDGATALRLTHARCSIVTGEGDDQQVIPLAWDSLPARLEVAAYDTVYDRYFEQVLARGAVPMDRAGAGLTGAVGVFAGTAVTTRPVMVVPATP